MTELTVPTMTEILQIAPALESTVTEDLLDSNGHMSLPHYVAAAARGVWARKRAQGLEQLLDEELTFFITEQHGRYMGELVRDDEFAAHTRFMARSTRALHTVTYIVDRRRERLASAIESVSVCVSKNTRRSADITPALAASFDVAIGRDAASFGGHSLCSKLWR